MKSRFYLFMSLICLCWFSCNSKDDQWDEVVNDDPYFVSLDDAIKQAEAFYEKIGQEVTRTGKERKVQNVQNVNLLKSSTRTRSSAEYVNPSLYLVNFEDNAGFALLSSDNRLPPIFGISEKGSLYMQDTIENKGLAIVMERIAKNIEYFDIHETHETRSISNPIFIPPMLASGVSEWHQGRPFNELCFTSTGQQAYVGCTAIATAQIISYYNWPEEIGNLALDWPEIKIQKEADYSTQYLLSELGSPQYLNIHYGQKLSYISSDSLNICFRRAFQKLNYYDPWDFKNFNLLLVNSELRNGPIIVKGEALLAPIPYILKNTGHTWVIDGGEFGEKTLLHCVWGLGEYKNNGYFLFGYIDTDSDVVYTKKMKFLSNFRPINK